MYFTDILNSTWLLSSKGVRGETITPVCLSISWHLLTLRVNEEIPQEKGSTIPWWHTTVHEDNHGFKKYMYIYIKKKPSRDEHHITNLEKKNLLGHKIGTLYLLLIPKWNKSLYSADSTTWFHTKATNKTSLYLPLKWHYEWVTGVKASQKLYLWDHLGCSHIPHNHSTVPALQSVSFPFRLKMPLPMLFLRGCPSLEISHLIH